MDIETVKKIISENLKGFPSKIRKIRKSELYYENKNDILRRRNPLADKIKDKDPDNPLRNADNRISHSFHQLLVNQKAAYAMTVPPLFDVDDKTLNQEIVKLLGDVYPKVAKDLSMLVTQGLHGYMCGKMKNTRISFDMRSLIRSRSYRFTPSDYLIN